MQTAGPTLSESVGLVAALEVQVQSECRHVAALRVRVQGSPQKCKCKECECRKLRKLMMMNDYSAVSVMALVPLWNT